MVPAEKKGKETRPGGREPTHPLSGAAGKAGASPPPVSMISYSNAAARQAWAGQAFGHFWWCYSAAR